MLDLIEARDREFNSKRLAVEDESANRIGKRLFDIGTVDVADCCRLPLSIRPRQRLLRLARHCLRTSCVVSSAAGSLSVVFTKA